MPIFYVERASRFEIEPNGFLEDEQPVAELVVLHSSTHASDNLCIARPDVVLLPSDHVMIWNSPLVRASDCNKRNFYDLFQRLIETTENLTFPGFGSLLRCPVRTS